MALTIPRVRTKAGAGDDANPNTTEPPVGDVIGGTQLRGVRGHLIFPTPPDTADVEFWVKNAHVDAPATDQWVLAGALVAVADREMFEHTGIGESEVYLRIVNSTAADSVDIFAEGF